MLFRSGAVLNVDIAEKGRQGSAQGPGFATEPTAEGRKWFGFERVALRVQQGFHQGDEPVFADQAEGAGMLFGHGSQSTPDQRQSQPDLSHPAGRTSPVCFVRPYFPPDSPGSGHPPALRSGGITSPFRDNIIVGPLPPAMIFALRGRMEILPSFMRPPRRAGAFILRGGTSMRIVR